MASSAAPQPPAVCGTLAARRVDFEPLWQRVAEGVLNVLNLRKGTCGMPIVEDIYALCTASPAPFEAQLYDSLCALLVQHVTRCADGLMPSSAQACHTDVDVLAKYLEQWRRYSLAAVYLDNLFRYLNMHWIYPTQQRQQATAPFARPLRHTSNLMELLYPEQQQQQEQDQRRPARYAPPFGRRGLNASQRSSAPPPRESTAAANAHSGAPFPQPKPQQQKVYLVGTLCLRVWAEYAYYPLRDVLLAAMASLINRKRSRIMELSSGTDATPPHTAPLALPHQPQPHYVQQDFSGSEDGGGSLVEQLLGCLKKLGAAIAPRNALTLYRIEGEAVYLAQLRELCLTQAGPFIATQGMRAYLAAANRMVKEELALGLTYLDPASHSPLLALLYDCLVVQHASAIRAECPLLLAARDTDALRSLYELIDLRCAKECMASIAARHTAAEAARGAGRRGDIGSAIYFSEESKSGVIDKVADAAQTWFSKDGLEQLSHECARLAPSSTKGVSLPFIVGYIEFMLELHNQFVDLVQTCFGNHPRFVASLGCAERIFVNNGDCCSDAAAVVAAAATATVSRAAADQTNRSRVPELLARYVDFCLYTGMRNRTQVLQLSKHRPVLSRTAFDAAEVDKLMADVVTVFGFVTEKDAFLRLYSQLLARRLVSLCTLSEDTEGKIIRGLRGACGAEAVSRMARMFRDVENSHELHHGFGQYCNRHGMPVLPCGFVCSRFTVQVLTSGFWPIAQSQDACVLSMLSPEASALVRASTAIAPHLPEHVHTCERIYTEYYTELHQGRKLQWRYEYTHAVLHALYSAQPLDLEISNIVQLFLLLQFEREASSSSGGSVQSSTITLDALCSTGVAKSTLELYLSQLCRLRLLKRDTAAGGYRLNTAFASPKRKLSLPWWAPKAGGAKRSSSASWTSAAGTQDEQEYEEAMGTASTESERLETLRQLNQERQLRLQSVIMRVMKSKKTATQTDLAAAVHEQCQRSVLTFYDSLFRAGLDVLVDQQYLSRSADTPPVFTYLP